MTEHLIGLSQDHLAPILERVETRMEERGVLMSFASYTVGHAGSATFEGMGNHYLAQISLPALTEQPSPEQAHQMVADMVLSVEQGLLQRRTEIEE